MRRIGPTLAALLAIPALSAAQPVDSLSQQGRRIIAGAIGVTHTAEATAGASGSVAANANGVVASLSYLQFVAPALAVELSGTLLAAAASADQSGTRSTATSALLLGINYAPRQLALAPAIRPFVSAALGPYFHHRAVTGIGGAGASSESRVGARLGAGSQFHLARHLTVVAEGDYHLVGQFTSSDDRGLSGFSLTLGLGFAWGR